MNEKAKEWVVIGSFFLFVFLIIGGILFIFAKGMSHINDIQDKAKSYCSEKGMTYVGSGIKKTDRPGVGSDDYARIVEVFCLKNNNEIEAFYWRDAR